MLHVQSPEVREGTPHLGIAESLGLYSGSAIYQKCESEQITSLCIDLFFYTVEIMMPISKYD